MNPLIAQFSEHLFWDVDRDQLDLEKHRKFIVRRALGHGQMRDWQVLNTCYPLEAIVDTAKSLRSLDPKTLAFIACVGGTAREDFRCYTAKPYSQTHWIP